MTYAQKHSFDVFVSYAHVDNEPMKPAKQGWVAVLIDNLDQLLAKQLGRREILSHWFDQHSLQGNNRIRDHIPGQARDSALFLAILSPGYLKSDFCLREMKAFVEAHREELDGRLFVVEHMQIPEYRDIPEEFRDLRRYKFWRTDQGNQPRTFALPTPLVEEREYYQKIDDLARDMAAKLTTDSVPRASGPSVFLAEVTDDLEQRRDDVQRYLEQAGIQVLPSCTYRLVRDDFERSCVSDLAKCIAFVQLLGPIAGKRPPDVPKGFGWLQLELAKQQKLPILQWRNPELDLSSVEAQLQKTLLEGEWVQAVALEDFKRSIVSEVKRIVAPPPLPPPRGDENETSFVFINANVVDAKSAETIKDSLADRFGWAMPLSLYDLDAKAEELDDNVESNMINSDGLVIVYGAARPAWVTSQLLLYRKLKPRRAKNPRLLAIVEAPPSPKTPLPIGLPGMLTVGIDKVADALKTAFPQ